MYETINCTEDVSDYNAVKLKIFILYLNLIYNSYIVRTTIYLSGWLSGKEEAAVFLCAHKTNHGMLRIHCKKKDGDWYIYL